MLFRILVVDDDALVRSALAMVLGGAAGICLVAEATDGDEVPAAVDADTPDVVLMDIRMPRMDGLTATEMLRRRQQPPEVIVLTAFHADDQVLHALRAGASGFLRKETPPGDIVAAIRRVAAGEAMLASVIRQLIAPVAESEFPRAAHNPRQQRAAALLDRLSDREREVALAVGRGMSNAQIAGDLYMSVATVKAQVSRTLTKLDLDNRVQVALLAHEAGLI